MREKYRKRKCRKKENTERVLISKDAVCECAIICDL
jgi:hypothetical protein